MIQGQCCKKWPLFRHYSILSSDDLSGGLQYLSLPVFHIHIFILSESPSTYRSLWLLSAERSLEERSPLGVSESWEVKEEK